MKRGISFLEHCLIKWQYKCNDEKCKDHETHPMVTYLSMNIHTWITPTSWDPNFTFTVI